MKIGLGAVWLVNAGRLMVLAIWPDRLHDWLVLHGFVRKPAG